MAVPFFHGNNDPGSNFTSLLRTIGVEPFVTAKGSDQTAVQAPHGTTVLAVRYSQGVVMAGDRRATMGSRISNREMEKVVPADRHSGVAISGAAGVAMDMIKLFQLQLEHFEKLDGRSISLEGKANQLSQMVRGNLSGAMQGLAVIPIFAGFDLIRNTGRLWDFDVTGGRYEEREFVATGSGGGPASTVLKVGFKPNMTADEAIDLCCRAILEASDVDSATGGPDALRNIYPIVATITDVGWERCLDTDLADRFESILQQQRQQRDGSSS